MDALLPFLDGDQLAPWLMRGLVDRAVDDFGRFLLVFLRLSGLMILGPIFGQSTVPMNVRALLVLALALMIAPALPDHLRRGFDQLDIDQNGLLSRDEVTPAGEARFDVIQQVSAISEGRGLTREEYAAWSRPRLPQNLVQYGLIAAGELSLGLLLGLGVMIILSGLQLAGQIVDQQAGFSLGEIINPDFDSTGSVSGQALSYLGMTMFVVMEPFGGHLTMLRLLVETFETLPLGEAVASRPAMELVGGLVQESLILGLRVAAPMIVMMTLIDLTLGFLGHSVPQVNIQAIGYATRASLCLLILVVMLSDIPDVISTAVPHALEELHDAIVFPFR